MNWSTPFHGVSHAGTFSLRTNWVTVEDHRSFALLKKWYPGCGFSPIETQHETPEAAKHAGEEWLNAKG